MKILAICGSLRTKSRNKGLVRAMQKLSLPDQEIILADLQAMPFYNEDIQVKPLAVTTLITQAKDADAFIFACPEYNYSLAPALKNALDWLSKEANNECLDGKPALLVGAGGGMGTSRSQAHLRQSCVYLNINLFNKPEFFSNAFSQSFADNGDLIDPKLEEILKTSLEQLHKKFNA